MPFLRNKDVNKISNFIKIGTSGLQVSKALHFTEFATNELHSTVICVLTLIYFTMQSYSFASCIATTEYVVQHLLATGIKHNVLKIQLSDVFIKEQMELETV